MIVPDDFLQQVLPPPPVQWEGPGPSHAAVLLPVFTHAGQDQLLFVVRRADLRRHPGQVAFPGGMRHGDETPVQCALREASEETGLPVSALRSLGGLGTRTSSSGITVHAVVGRILDPQGLQAEPGEVARLLVVPLAALRREADWRHQASPQSPTMPPSPHFDYGGDTIWGLTGRFTFAFVRALAGLPA